MIRIETIKKKREFSEIFASAESVKSSLLVVYVQGILRDNIRFGICVAKKAGGSVERNRVKRRLREIVRTNLHRIKRGFNIIIVARYPCKNANYHQIQEKFLHLCEKAGIMI